MTALPKTPFKNPQLSKLRLRAFSQKLRPKAHQLTNCSGGNPRQSALLTYKQPTDKTKWLQGNTRHKMGEGTRGWIRAWLPVVLRDYHGLERQLEDPSDTKFQKPLNKWQSWSFNPGFWTSDPLPWERSLSSEVQSPNRILSLEVANHLFKTALQV
jgi:hypothetical protein